MSHASRIDAPRPRASSPLTLADRLIALAREVDRAGFRAEAQRLLEIADAVLDGSPATPAHPL